jgi:hypothetical protein
MALCEPLPDDSRLALRTSAALQGKKMNSIRRELLNGVFVLVVANLLSAAFAAFQISFNLQLWVLILMAMAIAVADMRFSNLYCRTKKALRKPSNGSWNGLSGSELRRGSQLSAGRLSLFLSML